MANKFYSVFFLLIAIVFPITGCSFFSGPSDPEIIQAINETGRFKGGVESFTLLSSIVIVKKGGRTRDGYWPVKVKFKATYSMSSGKTTDPLERTAQFRLYKTVDGTGKTTWSAR